MNVLFIHQYLGAFGGAETNILLSASELRARGHQCDLLYLEKTGLGERNWTNTFSNCLQYQPTSNGDGFHEALHYCAPDVVYFHNLKDLHLLEYVLSASLPAVRMVHDHEMYCLRGYKYNYLTRRICHRKTSFYCVFPCGASLERNHGGAFPVRWASYLNKQREIQFNRGFDRLFVYSEYCKQELVGNGFAAERIQVYVPLDTSNTACAGSSFSGRNLILFAGQLIRGKGVDLLLRALSKLNVDFECVIVGDGNHRSSCEKLSHKLNLTGRVHFRGFVSRAELKELYEDACVLAVPSVWPEPFGMVGPEAMLSGLPVVAFDAGGISEWLTDGENGFLVPWMDIPAFATRLETLLLNKNLARRMGENGRERVVRDYTAGKHVDKLESTLLDLVEERKSSTPVLNTPVAVGL